MKKVFYFIVAMVLSFIPGFIGVTFTPSGASDVWYNALNKSILTPDGWVFGVAWTVLYALLGIALFLVMSNDRARAPKTRAYLLFLTQMVLNALWTYLFFGAHMAGAAMIVLVVLIFIAIWMARAFRPINRVASYLVWPYIIWMLFAAYLNGVILYMN